MKKIDKLPKFAIGQVIDMVCNNMPPHRILIKSVFMCEDDNEWMYRAFVENSNRIITIHESLICDYMHMLANNNQEYKDLYNKGWRFCGNFDKNVAEDVANKYASNKNIKNVILKKSNDCGIWIRYNTYINNQGDIISCNKNVIIVK